MKKLQQALLPLLALMAMTACGRVERHVTRATDQVTITRSWPADGIRQLNVHEVNGSISVEATPSATEISLVATASGELDKRPNEENQGLFQTTMEGDVLRIGRKKEHRAFQFHFFFDDDDETKIDYVLKVPASLDVRTVTVNGRITTRGIEGETEAVTVNGIIDMETAGTKEVEATTVNGTVRARFTRDFQGARFKTVNGGVEAVLPASASFDVDLSQVNGDFDASFPLSIHSSPGSRRVSGEVNGGAHRLKIVTVNGDIELRRATNATGEL